MEMELPFNLPNTAQNFANYCLCSMLAQKISKEILRHLPVIWEYDIKKWYKLIIVISRTLLEKS